MSFDKRKTNPELGQKVRKHLTELKVETPIKQFADGGGAYTTKQKIDRIEANVRNILETLDMDLTDDSIADTPKRVAKMFVSELFYGLDTDTFPKCTVTDNKFNFDEMVVERNISVMSCCEHHFQPIDGFATVGYIPDDKVLGLSKLNRIVEYFSKRPQVQERLTCQIIEALKLILETDNVAIVIDAKHFCVKCRGVEDVNAMTTTSKLSGAFKEDPATRAEFMSLSRKG